jgi:hypothetical protein
MIPATIRRRMKAVGDTRFIGRPARLSARSRGGRRPDERCPQGLGSTRRLSVLGERDASPPINVPVRAFPGRRPAYRARQNRRSQPRDGHVSGVGLMVEASLILTWRQPEAALEVAVQVTLIGEAGGGGDIGDRLAGFEQLAGLADTVRELQRVGW